MEISLITFLATVTSSLVCVMSVIPIPSVHPGFVLQGSRNSEIVIEVFLGLNCKESKETWLTLKGVASKYKIYQKHMSFILHMFPLPEYRCGFLSSQAWNMVIDSKEDEVVSFIDAAFREMDTFSNLATYNQTNYQIEQELANLVQASTGISVEHFVESFNNFSKPTILQWKYAVKRGVAGTPCFFVNGVDLMNPEEAIALEAWENILEPLLDASPHLRQLEVTTLPPSPCTTSKAATSKAAADCTTSKAATSKAAADFVAFSTTQFVTLSFLTLIIDLLN